MSKETNKKTGKKTKTRIIICERCGKEVLTTACHQKYCKECMKEVKIESKRRYIRSRLLKKHENMPLELLMKMRTIVCERCGKEVLMTSYHQKYCKECGKKVRIESRRKYVQLRPLKEKRTLWTTAVCPVCGELWKVKTEWGWSGNGKMRKICDGCRKKVPYRFYETVRIGGVVT